MLHAQTWSAEGGFLLVAPANATEGPGDSLAVPIVTESAAMAAVPAENWERLRRYQRE